MNRLSKEIQQSLLLDRKSIPLQWTLHKLATLSKQQNNAIKNSSTSSLKVVPSAIGLTNKRQRPCQEFTQTLIQDVRVRLSKQHGMCLDILHQAKEMMNQNAYKQMSDLEMLHADTYSLLHQISPSSSSSSSSSYGSGNKNKLSDAAYDKLTLSIFEQIRSRHALTLEPLSDITSTSTSPLNTNNIIPNTKLDILLRRRLSIQLLCDHYVWYTKYKKDTGTIYINHNFVDLVNEAIIESKHICDANIGYAPDVNVHLGKYLHDDDDNACMTLIRTWTYHSLIELLKNAMSSTVQKYQQNNDKHNILPSIDVYINKQPQNNQIVCSIVDQGIGIDTKTKPISEYFKFACTKHRWDRLQDQQSYATVRAPLQGLGVGLNQSLIMMQMFGGNILLSSNKNDNIDSSSFVTSATSSNTGLNNSGCTATLILPLDTSIPEYSIVG